MTNLPLGTVSFLFTDIEGSTRLLLSLGDRYADVLADHRDLMRNAFDQWNGQEVDTQGDAFFVAFSRASDGVAAAVEIQHAMAAHEWPDGIEVRVRMGLHTGEPIAGRDSYVGMDVHRAARIAHIGHGGQVLLSESSVSLVRDHLPDDVSLRDLGEYQLKDLSRPEPIYQLTISGLQADFPSLKSLDARPNNLPVQLTSFVGRKREIEEVKAILERERLVTLTGPGGTGKTRLSIQVAADLAEQFPDGVWLVELEPIDTSDYLVPAIASEMQFAIDGHSSDLDPEKQLIDYLGRRSLLLILDNFEHLVDGASLVTNILANASGIKLLITSREKLNLREEWSFPVAGMTYPENGGVENPESFSGLKLFLQRAQQVNPRFDLVEDDVPCVSRVCQLVEGMPLGIELAAGWISMLSCSEIADEIEKSLDFLESSMRGIPDKHRSLRAVFDESWRRLNETQQAGLRSLSIFSGGFSREAASEVAEITLPVLADFSNKSLLHRDDEGRFEMHALLKAFAKEKLIADSDEYYSVQEKHSRFYVRFLQERAVSVQGENLVPIREEIRVEIGNIRDAIRWVITCWDTDEARRALLFFNRYLQTEGFHESMEMSRRLALFMNEQESPNKELLLYAQATQAVWGATIGDPESIELIQSRMPALREVNRPFELGVGLLATGIGLEYQAEFRQSIQILEECYELIKGLGEDFPIASCLSWLGWAHYELGEYDQAGEYFQIGYQHCVDTNNVIGLPYMLSKLGTWSDALQNYTDGLDYHQRAQKYFKMVGDQAGQGYALSRMSLSAWGLEYYKESLQFGRDGFEQFDRIGHRWGRATSLSRIGFAQLGLNQPDLARNSFLESLQLSQEYGYPSTAAYALIGLASLWAVEGEEIKAVELLALVIDQPFTPPLYADIGRRTMTDLESTIPAAEITTAQEHGRSAEFEDAVEDILMDFKTPFT